MMLAHLGFNGYEVKVEAFINLQHNIGKSDVEPQRPGLIRRLSAGGSADEGHLG